MKPGAARNPAQGQAITREMHRRTELCVPVMPIRMPLSGNDDIEDSGTEFEAANDEPLRFAR